MLVYSLLFDTFSGVEGGLKNLILKKTLKFDLSTCMYVMYDHYLGRLTSVVIHPVCHLASALQLEAVFEHVVVCLLPSFALAEMIISKVNPATSPPEHV